MAFKKLTLRRMPPITRKYARLLNELDSVVTRGRNLVEEIARLERDSRALYARKQAGPDEVLKREREPLFGDPMMPDA